MSAEHSPTSPSPARWSWRKSRASSKASSAATANALAAGFDGVEIHGANGYLLDQFARDGTNKRTDAYGGSIENRARLMLEVSKVVAAEAGAERTGIRISPVTPANDVSDSNPQPLFDYIVDHLNALKLAYIHVIEGATGGPRDIAPFDYGSLRKRFKGAYIANNGYDFELATKVLAANEADLIAFGKPFISNPDLVERLQARRAAQRRRQGHVLRRRRQGLHGLSGARRSAGCGAVGRHTASCHTRESGYPVVAGVSDRTESARRTGSSAFADDDNSGKRKGRDHSRLFCK